MINQKNNQQLIISKSVNNLQRIVVLVPGFLEDFSHHLFSNSSNYFSDNGFDVLFVEQGLYSFSDNIRDLSSAIENLKHKDVYLVAHSLGAVTGLLSASLPGRISKIVLWDPSLHPKDMFRDYLQDKKLFRLTNKTNKTTLSRKYLDEALNVEPIESILKKMSAPLCVVTAEKGGHKIGKNLYYNNATGEKSFHVIKNANHNFDGVQAEFTLYKLTIDWFN